MTLMPDEELPAPPKENRKSILWNVLITLGLLVCLILVGTDMWRASQEQAAAELNAQELASAVRQTCESGGPAAVQLGEYCERAREVEENPTTPVQTVKGDPGRGIIRAGITSDGFLELFYTDDSSERVGRVQAEDGTNGISITDADISEGNLVLSFSNGTTRNAGRVVGDQGIPGTDGTPGIDGTPGVDGVDGDDGTNGLNGQDGRGVADVIITEAGDLQIAYTDAPELYVSLGQVRGPQGPPGADGADGEDAKQIAAFDIESGGAPGEDALITFNDGTTLRGRVCPEGYGLGSRTVLTPENLVTGEEILACVPLE